MPGIYRAALLGCLLSVPACSSLGRGITYQTIRANFEPCPVAESLNARVVSGPDLRYIEARKVSPIAQVLYLHGVAKGACDRISLIAPLQALGCDVLLAEYPGFDGLGDANETGILRSALAIRDKMAAEFPKLPLILYGESLGTAVATYVASERGCAALILQSPFPSVTKVGQHSYPMLPVHLFLTDSFPAETWAQNVTAPLLAFYGSSDWIVPPKFSKEQVKNFKGPVELLEFKGAGHETMIAREAARYFGAIEALLKRVTGAK